MIDVGSAYFCCDECPISEDVERRYRNADEAGAFQYDHCGCGKIDYPFFVGGYCDDAFCQKDDFERTGKRKTGKAYRRKMRVKKRNDLMRAIEGCYVRDIWHRKGAYIVYPKNSKAKKYYRNYSNRLIRRGKVVGAGKGGYRRCFDYKWEVY